MADISVMEEKWRNFFKLLDIDKDGHLSVKDRDFCIGEFSKQPCVNPEAVKSDLDLFWNNVLFLGAPPDWNKELTEDDFIKMFTEAFTADKTNFSDTVKTALKHLISAADFNQDKIFTFDKFFQFHVCFNLPVEIIVKTTFNFIAPEADGTCSFDDVYNFYVELFIGEDVAKFEDLKNAYKALGLM